MSDNNNDNYVTHQECAKHRVGLETNNGKLWSAIGKNQVHIDHLIKMQWWAMGILSAVVVSIIVMVIGG